MISARAPASALPLVLAGWVLGSCGDDRPGSGLDPESLVAACVRTAACGIVARARVSDCVASYSDRVAALGLTPVIDPIYRCANGATGCAAIARCFGAGGACDASFSGRCDGQRAVFCDLIDDRVYSYDCGGAGLDCAVDPSHAFAADCIGGGATVGGLRLAASCPEDRCHETGEACDADSLDRCAGAALQSCLGGQWVEFDCAALGLGACERRGQASRCAPRG